MAREQQAYVFIYLPGETTAVPAGVFTHYPDDGIGGYALTHNMDQGLDAALPWYLANLV